MKRWHILLLDGLLIALIPIAGLLSGLMINMLPDCLLYKQGLLCPACGGTRCIRYLAQLKPLAAFKMNPYIFCTAIICVGLLILLNAAVLSGGKYGLLKKLCRPTFVILWAIGFVLFGILRNIL